MSKMQNVMNNFIFVVLTLILFSTPVHGFDDVDTHPRITRKSINNSSLGAYLKLNMGLVDGDDTQFKKTNNNTFRKQSVFEWLQQGSTDEDNPMCKAMNHFHDPLKPWSESYMTDVPWVFQLCSAAGWSHQYSNVTWATGHWSPGGTSENLGTLVLRMLSS